MPEDMSGRIAANNGPATKSDFARLHSRVDSILSRLSVSAVCIDSVFFFYLMAVTAPEGG